jgi:hypothetical protein
MSLPSVCMCVGIKTEVPLAFLFDSNSNSYAVSTQTDMCMYICTYMLQDTETLVERKK